MRPIHEPLAAISATDREIQSLPQFIYEQLRASILDGSLRPGQILRQEELATRFNTSRVPLREALQHLQAQGLVELRPRRGFAVTSLDEHEILGLLQLRMLLEGYAGYAATLARTDEDVRKLELCVRTLEKIPSNNMSDAQLARWATLNRRFHDTLFAAAHNPELARLTANLSARIQPYILLELTHTLDLVDGHEYHREIFEAFRQRDAGKVALLSRRHCEMTAIRFVEVLQRRGLLAELSAERVTDLGPAVDMDRSQVGLQVGQTPRARTTAPARTPRSTAAAARRTGRRSTN